MSVAVGRLGRLESIDALRGAAILGMILVNNPGSPSRPFATLRHAAWNGFTLADAVFPGFLFVMGMSMAQSFAHRRGGVGAGASLLWPRVLRRSVILVALGLALNFVVPLVDGPLRVPGVLQRIGLTYLLASATVLLTPRRWYLALVPVILLGYAWVMSKVAVPGFGAGVLTPEGNLAGFVDRSVFGQDHLYRLGPYDPEGLLSTLPAVATVLLGYAAGDWVRVRVRAGRSWAAAGLVAAGVLALATSALWSSVLPINKRLWSSSFVLWSGGFALLAAALVYEVVEHRRMGRSLSKPLVVLGFNALAVYLVSELIGRVLEFHWAGGRPVREWVYEQAFRPWAGARLGSLCYSLAFVTALTGVAALAYRRRLSLRL
ncbi:MAG: acyltransferase family protein [Acidimicrobiales bacterium]